MKNKRVFVIGGTGFLGYHAIQEFLLRGWQATALGLPPAPPEGLFPNAVRVISKNLEQTPDGELLAMLRGHAALVFAAGLDDRAAVRKPAYAAFHRANVEIPLRVLTIAARAGIQQAVILGSYFAYFNRLWPEMRLAERHPYIRSRVEQEKVLTSLPGLKAVVLELPYVFGSLPVRGWQPLWRPLVNYLRATPLIFYMRGGTSCVSARTVGRAIVAAIENGRPGACYPIGGENLSWSELLTRLGGADGRRVRVVTLPDWLLRIGLSLVWLRHARLGMEGGLDPRFFAPIQTAESFLDPEASQKALGFESASLEEALLETLRACGV